MRRETDVQETNLQVRPTTGRGWESGVAAVDQNRESRMPRSVPLVTPSPIEIGFRIVRPPERQEDPEVTARR